MNGSSNAAGASAELDEASAATPRRSNSRAGIDAVPVRPSRT
jgi:hypothetical protein